MECPKCGAVQPESDTCVKCHVIISKYLKPIERSNSAQPHRSDLRREDEAKKGSFAIKVIIIAVLVISLAVAAFWLNPFKGPDKGEYSKADGVYRNETYGFRLKLPAAWRTYSVKDAIECQTIVSEYADNYFLFASPTEPSHSMIVIQQSGLTADYFKATPWESIVAETASLHPVTFKSIDTLGNLRVHRVGYTIANAYREDNYFMADGKLMQVYFYVVSPEASPELLQEMKNIVEKTLESI